MSDKEKAAHDAKVICVIPNGILLSDDPINELVEYLRKNIISWDKNGLFKRVEYEDLLVFIDSQGYSRENCNILKFLNNWEMMEKEFYEDED